jgi:hypothetical protein
MSAARRRTVVRPPQQDTLQTPFMQLRTQQVSSPQTVPLQLWAVQLVPPIELAVDAPAQSRTCVWPAGHAKFTPAQDGTMSATVPPPKTLSQECVPPRHSQKSLPLSRQQTPPAGASQELASVVWGSGVPSAQMQGPPLLVTPQLIPGAEGAAQVQLPPLVK